MGIKIGVFDSGIGGVTVLSELRRHLDPRLQPSFVYLGDTANLPYGSKSPAQIEQLSRNCAQILKEKEIDALVVACNTASSWALSAIQEVMGEIPVFGVVEPGVQAALKAFQDLHSLNQNQDTHPTRSFAHSDIPILVLATRATVQSKSYGRHLQTTLEAMYTELPFTPSDIRTLAAGRIFEQACPLLVPLIEEGWIDHPILHQVIVEYVRPYFEKFPVGVALLGCTHYPWIQSAFEKALPGWTVVNSANSIANIFSKLDLNKGPAPEPFSIEWIFTDPEAVPAFARSWIKEII